MRTPAGETDGKTTSWFDKVTSQMEQNTRGVHIAIYSVALGGLVLALRRVRPFKKFTKPQEIPSSFFQRHIRLSGKVLRIDFSPKPLLIVDHSPIIGSKYRELGPGLPVNIEGIDITANGVSWLQSVVVGNGINFTLLVLQPNYVGCTVTHKHININIANTLVRKGFASVAPFNPLLESDPLYKSYYYSLLKDEARAERDGEGMWWDRSPTMKSRLLQMVFAKMPSLKQRI